jgi:hypothetical protein
VKPRASETRTISRIIGYGAGFFIALAIFQFRNAERGVHRFELGFKTFSERAKPE